jgi:hypothetical protein
MGVSQTNRDMAVQAAQAEEPRRLSKKRVKHRVLIAGYAVPPGIARGFMAATLVATLIALQFTSPASNSELLARALQTLVFAVVAFYFGGRRARRPIVAQPAAEAEPGQTPSVSGEGA